MDVQDHEREDDELQMNACAVPPSMAHCGSVIAFALDAVTPPTSRRSHDLYAQIIKVFAVGGRPTLLNGFARVDRRGRDKKLGFLLLNMITGSQLNGSIRGLKSNSF
ncbi:hypothetical protein EVAR_31385_1 [Eumeta japonica]|uniref:Uncharacterized protein n=1 Tax=Eumeta variegata TaxID=151549 RepID=A0A4C1XCF8_EUMVA|nr:hypothetical protein EVAR_31385_1 [Eumeta japonica]